MFWKKLSETLCSWRHGGASVCRGSQRLQTSEFSGSWDLGAACPQTPFWCSSSKSFLNLLHVFFGIWTIDYSSPFERSYWVRPQMYLQTKEKKKLRRTLQLLVRCRPCLLCEGGVCRKRPCDSVGWLYDNLFFSASPLSPYILFIPIWYFKKLADCYCNHPLSSALLGFTGSIYLVLLHAGLPARSTVVNFLFKIVFLSVKEKTTGMLGCKLFGESPVNIHILNKKALQLLISVYCLTVCTRRERVIGMCSLLLVGLYI